MNQSETPSTLINKKEINANIRLTLCLFEYRTKLIIADTLYRKRQELIQIEGENLYKDDCIYKKNDSLRQWLYEDLTFYKIN